MRPRPADLGHPVAPDRRHGRSSIRTRPCSGASPTAPSATKRRRRTAAPSSNMSEWRGSKAMSRWGAACPHLCAPCHHGRRAGPLLHRRLGHKPVLGFAAGGFVLLNRKRDFVDTFGDAGEAVSYSSADELAAKIDLYLTKPALRREIGGAIREKLFARHTLQATLARVLEQATAEIERRAPGACRDSPVRSHPRPAAAASAMEQMAVAAASRTAPKRRRARVRPRRGLGLCGARRVAGQIAR